MLPSYCSENSRRSENTHSFPKQQHGGPGCAPASGHRGAQLREDASPETQPHRIPSEEQLREGAEGVAEAPRTGTLWRARGQHTAVGRGAEPTWGRTSLCLHEATHRRHLRPAEGGCRHGAQGRSTLPALRPMYGPRTPPRPPPPEEPQPLRPLGALRHKAFV